jgi:hypothetical protein
LESIFKISGVDGFCREGWRNKMGFLRWFRETFVTGKAIKPGHEPTFNFNQGPDETPKLPIDPYFQRPGQPRIKKEEEK